MGSEEPSALFFVADGAAKERVQCRNRQRENAASESAHKAQRNMKYGFELKKTETHS